MISLEKDLARGTPTSLRTKICVQQTTPYVFQFEKEQLAQMKPTELIATFGQGPIQLWIQIKYQNLKLQLHISTAEALFRNVNI